MRQAPVVTRLVVALHLIEMVGDAIDLPGRILHGQDSAIRGLGRIVRGGLRLSSGLLGMSCRLLRLRRRRFRLLGLLLVMRCAPRDRNSEQENG